MSVTVVYKEELKSDCIYFFRQNEYAGDQPYEVNASEVLKYPESAAS